MSFNRFLVLFAGVMLWTATVGNAATFTVDSNVDQFDASPGDGICADSSGACTLRAAIEEANALAGADSIDVPGGLFHLTITPSYNWGHLVITDDLEIDGAGRDITVIDGDRGQWVSGVLMAAQGTTVLLRDLTVQHGTAYGAGLYNIGTMTALRVGVRDNYSPNVAGGIYNEPGADLTLVSCVISGNRADNVGGGLYNEGHVTVVGTTFEGNSAGNAGGGFHNEGSGTVANSTFSGNDCGNVGAGIHVDTSLSVNNSTFTGNTAHNTGGAVAVGEHGSVSVRNSILSGNTECKPQRACVPNDCFGNVNSGGHNLIGTLAACDLNPVTGDLFGVDPLLGPLQDNGGPTETFALTSGSPAIDAGGSDCEGDAQRTLPRPQGAACDIGAYEAIACDYDGELDAGEDCDDGNTDDGDGCSSLCQTELLGGASLRLAIGSTGAKLTTSVTDARVRLGWGNLSPDDPVLNGAVLQVRGAGGSAFDIAYALPAVNWSYIGRAGRNRGYKYKDSVGMITSVLVRPGRLVRVKGSGGPEMTMNLDPAPVDVVLTMGGRTFAASFGGVTSYRAGRSYKARNAPAPQSPPF